MTTKIDGNKSGGALCVMKVPALTLPPNNELTLWCPGVDGRNHILKIYTDGDGLITIEPVSARVEIKE